MYEEALLALALAGRLNTKGKGCITYKQLKSLALQATGRILKKQMRTLRNPEDSYPALAEDFLANLYFAEQLGLKRPDSLKEVLEAAEHLKKIQLSAA